MVYFLSDAHIGSRAISDPTAHEQQICQYLMQLSHDATAIYLLGDIFDFYFEFVFHKPQEYALTLKTLRSLTDNGIEVHFFIGNHDIWTFGWLEQQTGVIVHREPETLIINSRRCLLAHGDGLIPSYMMQVYPKPVQRKIRRFQFLRCLYHCRPLQRLFSLVPPAWGNSLGYGWARRSRLRELAHPCGYKGENQEELVLYAKELEQTDHYDYYIFGHRHIELDLELAPNTNRQENDKINNQDNSTPFHPARVIILGDMFRQFTYAQMDNNGNLSLLNFEE